MVTEDLTLGDGVDQREGTVRQYARPINWKEITECYNQSGKMSTIERFSEEFGDRSLTLIDQALGQWSTDHKSNKAFNSNPSYQYPAYGEIIDILPFEQVKTRIDCGHPCDDTSLHLLLSTILVENGKATLLNENGGK